LEVHSAHPTHEYYVLQSLVDKIARFSGFLICPIYESNDRGTVPIHDAEAFTKNVPVLRILHWSDQSRPRRKITAGASA